jgi:hypothetical protein
MPDDEPLDDARAVAMAAAAAAAKIVETTARAAQDRRNSQQQQQQPTAEPVAAYDSPERRQAADVTMRAAGVQDEPRNARITSDLLNGADPAAAAASGKATKARPARPSKVPEQVRSR